jgi:hypothetical protein
MGARSATHQGAIGCFIFVGLSVLGMALYGGVAGYNTAEGIGAMVAIGIQAAIGLIAGLRMRNGKGAFWGIATAALLLLEIIVKLVSLTGIPGLVINVVLLIVIVQGIRGALALRSEVGFEDDDVEVFE